MMKIPLNHKEEHLNMSWRNTDMDHRERLLIDPLYQLLGGDPVLKHRELNPVPSQPVHT